MLAPVALAIHDYCAVLTGRLVKATQYYISHVTSSCEGTTTSCGLSKLDIETQDLETLRPFASLGRATATTTQDLSGY